MIFSKGTTQKTLALITDAWHPQVNGVVTAYASIIPLLEERGFAVTVIHPGLFRSVPIPFYPEIRFALFPRRKLRKILVGTRPDFIHIAVAGPLGLAARSICRAQNIPFTTAYHTHFQKYGPIHFRILQPAITLFLRWFHNGGAGTTVSTESLKRELESRGFRNLVLWPLGVDTEFFKRNPSPRLPSLPKPVFVFFSRLASEKSPEEFLKLQFPGTKLVIGDGPDRAKLEKIYGTSTTFIGYKRGQELVDWLSMGDVCVFPSRTETFGLVVLEALSCDLPVAAHDVPGPRDIISNGVDGYLSDDLHEAAMKCLRIDRTKCREKALRYSWTASSNAFIQNVMGAPRFSTK